MVIQGLSISGDSLLVKICTRLKARSCLCRGDKPLCNFEELAIRIFVCFDESFQEVSDNFVLGRLLLEDPGRFIFLSYLLSLVEAKSFSNFDSLLGISYDLAQRFDIVPIDAVEKLDVRGRHRGVLPSEVDIGIKNISERGNPAPTC
tara:strand:+ start:167 stop:607 length:441 start_codon:yes stop_codon:yes gene_type:complete